MIFHVIGLNQIRIFISGKLGNNVQLNITTLEFRLDETKNKWGK